MIWLLAVFAGCNDVPLNCSEGFQHRELKPQDFSIDEHPGTAIAVRSDDPGEMYTGVWTELVVTNRSDQDCLVAIYEGSTEPSVSFLPVLDPVTGPPGVVEGVGRLLSMVNLAPAPDGWGFSTYVAENVEYNSTLR